MINETLVSEFNTSYFSRNYLKGIKQLYSSVFTIEDHTYQLGKRIKNDTMARLRNKNNIYIMTKRLQQQREDLDDSVIDKNTLLISEMKLNKAAGNYKVTENDIKRGIAKPPKIKKNLKYLEACNVNQQHNLDILYYGNKHQHKDISNIRSYLTVKPTMTICGNLVNLNNVYLFDNDLNLKTRIDVNLLLNIKFINMINILEFDADDEKYAVLLMNYLNMELAKLLRSNIVMEEYHKDWYRATTNKDNHWSFSLQRFHFKDESDGGIFNSKAKIKGKPSGYNVPLTNIYKRTYNVIGM